MIDFAKTAELQVALMQDLDNCQLLPGDKVKFGRILIQNYLKAKKIINSRVEVAGDWETVLEVARQGLEGLVDSIEGDVHHTDDISANNVIGYVDLLSKIQFLDYEDLTQYKYVDNSVESEIDVSIFEDFE